MSAADKTSLNGPSRRVGIDKFAVELNAVAVRKRRAQKRWALKKTAARQPVTGGQSVSVPPGRAADGA